MSSLIEKYILTKKYKKVCYAILARTKAEPDSYFASYFSMDVSKYLIGKYKDVKYEAPAPDYLLYSLNEAENEEDLEKVILIYAHYPKFGKGIVIQTDGVKNSMNQLIGPISYEPGMLFLSRVCRELDMEQTVTAISLITDWQGSRSSFLDMVKSI